MRYDRRLSHLVVKNSKNGQSCSPPLADGEVHKPSARREYVSTNH